MAKPITIPNTFASATSAIPLSQLDQDFSTLANATNDLATYSNYVADTGAADAYIANYPANTNTSSLTTGLRLQFKAANANTGASTLNVQVNGGSIGTAAIRLTDGSALPANTIIAGALVDVMYDGTNFQIMNDPSGGQEIISNLTLSGNLTVAGTSTFTGNVTGNVVNTTTSTITNLTSGNVTITGGSIDNISITNLTSLTVDGNTTLGDASGDTLTITGTTVTTPNGLNFDSNTLVIDAANNRVGVGVASPSGKLSVATTGNSAVEIDDGGTISRVMSYDRTAGLPTDLQLYGSTLRLFTSSVAGSGTERMRITSAGFVGIGTSTPASIFHVDYDSSGIAPRISGTSLGRLDLEDEGVADSSRPFQYLSSDDGSLIFGNANRSGTGTTSSTERMRITSAGNVGIGTSSPSVRLEVVGGDFKINRGATNSVVTATLETNMSGSSSKNIINFFNLALDSGDPMAAIEQFDDGTNVNGTLIFKTNGAGTSAERMRIDSSGVVGINAATNLRGQLEVRRASLSAFTGTSLGNIVVSDSAATADYFVPIDFAVIPTTGTPPIARIAAQRTGSGSYLYFGTSSNYSSGITNSAMVIDYVGNVGIGTSSPATSFQVSRSGLAQVTLTDSSEGTNQKSWTFQYGTGVGTGTFRLRANNDAFTDGQNAYIITRTGNAVDTHQWLTAGAERMRIDSSGNVLVNGTVAAASTGGLTLNNATSGSLAYQLFLRSSGTANNSGSAIGFRGVSNTSAEHDYGYISVIADDTTAKTGSMRFSTTAGSSPLERMRITSSGYVKASNDGNYVSTSGVYHELRNTASDWVLYARNTAASNPYCMRANYSGAAPNNTGNQFLYCDDTSSLRAEIRSNGGLANYSANNSNLSDRREKTNFAPAKNYLDIICSIPVQTFNYIDQNLEEDDGLTLGVVAQDVQKVAPELVTESNWGTKEEPKMRLSIYQTDLQYALMKCIQEQQTMIVELTNRIKKLEGA